MASSVEHYVRRVAAGIREREVTALLAVLVLFPLVTWNWSLASYIVIYGLFAVAYNFCLGETGILTFGHAAFFGLGAYGCGVFLMQTGLTGVAAWGGLVAGAALAAFGGLVIGGLALRRTGTYLALITLGFAQMIWFGVFQWRSVTGGDDGLVGVPTPSVGIPGVAVFDIQNQIVFYLVLLIVFWLCLLVIRRLTESNFGAVLNAIRENPNRAAFLGYDVYRYQLQAFVVSATFSGVAGAFYPYFLNVVGLNTLHWQLSGEVNFWVLLGGVNTFVGPVIGTGLFLIIRDGISSLTDFWQLPVGLLIVAIVLFFPEGVLKTVDEWLDGALLDTEESPDQTTIEEGAD